MAHAVSPAVVRLSAIVAVVACGLIATRPDARADEPQSVAEPYRLQAQATPRLDPEAWRFTVAPYAWLMSVTGSTTVHGQTLDTNDSFIDLLQKSDSLIGFMGYFEADKGRVGAYADLVFSKLGFTASQVSYRNPLPGLKISATANAAMTLQMFVIEMGGVYELAKWNGSPGSYTALDALGGFRYWNINVDATFDALINVDVSHLHLERTAGFAIAHSGVTQWVDPLVGFRLRHQFTPNQEVFVRGDIGGFNLANSLTWQAVAAYSYRWQRPGYDVAAVVGFRALGINYNTGSGIDAVGLNEIFYGPIIGASFRF